MGCCGKSPSRPSRVTDVTNGAAPVGEPSNTTYRVIPPVGDPIDGFATREEAEAERSRSGGEIKRVIRT